MTTTSCKTAETKVRMHRQSVPQGFALKPPDGGWAWVVLVATFIAALSTVAAMSTFAVILNDLKSLFLTSTTTLSWAPSIEISTGLFLGPVYTIIINKYGCRKATILGGIFVSSGLMLSYFVTRVEFLILTYGVINGIGSGLCHLVFPVILSQYFKKYFGVAVGCLMASYAASRLIITPLAQIILDEYGCRATILLMGAWTLNICVSGCLYQPIKWHSVIVTVEREANSNQCKRKTEEILKEDKNNDISSETDEVRNRLLEGKGNQTTVVVYGDKNLHSHSVIYGTSHESTNVLVKEDNEKSNIESPNEKSCLSSYCAKGPCRAIDHTLWREYNFYIVSLSELIVVTIMVYSNVFLFPMGIEIGLPPMKTAQVISAKAMADIFGRLAGPSFITLFKLPIRYSFIILNAVHAIILSAYMLANSYDIYMSMSILSGFIFGIVVGLNNVLIVECMGVKRLSSVIGLSTFLQGFLLLPMAPIMGWIRDSTGSFKEVFLFQCILEAVLVILWSLGPLIANRSK